MTDRKSENLGTICRYLPERLSVILLSLDAERVKRLCEIRIRAGKPVVLIFTDERLFLTCSGRLTLFETNGLLKLSGEETETVFNMMCRYSVHSLSEDIAAGFITLDGGNRIGVYGRAVTEDGRVTAVRNICGLNIRVCGDFVGCAERLSTLIGTGKPENVLICGPPSSGKTTMLRDLCRILSDRRGLKVCLIDERCEADGCCVGLNTDVMSGYPKASGIQTAVRTLSPEVIAFDEIGAVGEVLAVREGLNSGVGFVMTMHCKNRQELCRKAQFRMLTEYGAIGSCVFLKNIGEISEIITAKELENENCGTDGLGRLLCSGGTVCGASVEYEGPYARKDPAYADGCSKQRGFSSFSVTRNNKSAVGKR